MLSFRPSVDAALSLGFDCNFVRFHRSTAYIGNILASSLVYLYNLPVFARSLTRLLFVAITSLTSNRPRGLVEMGEKTVSNVKI
jgi:hypothetical protein